MFFELRQCRTLPGKRADWAAFMEAVISPSQVAKGMVIGGSFVAQEEDDRAIGIRRFAGEEERVARYKAVYESDFWQNEVAPKVGALLDRPRMAITRIEATSKSAIQ